MLKADLEREVERLTRTLTRAKNRVSRLEDHVRSLEYDMDQKDKLLTEKETQNIELRKKITDQNIASTYGVPVPITPDYKIDPSLVVSPGGNWRPPRVPRDDEGRKSLGYKITR